MKKLLVVALAVFAITTTAEAANWWGGGDVGMSFPSKSLGSRFTYGAELGYKVTPEIGLLGYFSNNKKAYTLYDSKMMGYGIGGVYFFSGSLDMFYAGVLAGLTNNKIDFIAAATTDISANQLTFGPKIGFDYGIGSGFTTGLDISWLLAMEKTSGAVTYQSFSTFNTFATIKYWF